MQSTHEYSKDFAVKYEYYTQNMAKQAQFWRLSSIDSASNESVKST